MSDGTVEYVLCREERRPAMSPSVLHIVSARPELVERLHRLADARCVEIFTSPTVLCAEGPEPIGVEERDRLKRLFLARRRELAGISDEEAIRLLGDARICVEVFDRCWDVRIQVCGVGY